MERFRQPGRAGKIANVGFAVSPVPKIFSSLRAVPKKIRGWWRQSIQMDIEVCALFEHFLTVLSRGDFFANAHATERERKNREKNNPEGLHQIRTTIKRRALAAARPVIFKQEESAAVSTWRDFVKAAQR